MEKISLDQKQKMRKIWNRRSQKTSSWIRHYRTAGFIQI